MTDFSKDAKIFKALCDTKKAYYFRLLEEWRKMCVCSD